MYVSNKTIETLYSLKFKSWNPRTQNAHGISDGRHTQVGKCQVDNEVPAHAVHGACRHGDDQDDDVPERPQHERHGHDAAVDERQQEVRLQERRHVHHQLIVRATVARARKWRYVVQRGDVGDVQMMELKNILELNIIFWLWVTAWLITMLM